MASGLQRRRRHLMLPDAECINVCYENQECINVCYENAECINVCLENDLSCCRGNNFSEELVNVSVDSEDADTVYEDEFSADAITDQAHS